jgi:cellulose synthase/poly-beta-1,6-N-acetylglucosamine synthase-like glycosyltransferase
VRPGVLSFIVTLILSLGFSLVAWWLNAGAIGVIGWTTTILWTLPLTGTLLGLAGAARTIRRLRAARTQPPPRAAEHDRLIVVVPTIGRWDTYPALERVVGSYTTHLPRYFPRLRIDIVIEEGCAARDAIRQMAGPLVRVVTVPRHYRTPAGTRFKSRANHFAAVRRTAENEAHDGVWVLHMDDDTGVGPDTAAELARFINAQRERGPDGLHLAQGVLTYPREHGANRLLWLADAVRPAQDVSLFAITTGRGTPRAGLHGELLLVRASIEAEIGWDFGPRAVTEDTQFALNVAQRYPGRSDWFPGRSFGATPVALGDFLRQRERWAWGLLELSASSAIPLRHRLLLLHNMVLWSCGPLQHIAVIVLAGVLLGDLNTFPATALLLPLWSINVSYQVWSYWEGLAINARASTDARRHWWEAIVVVVLIPIFSLWEVAGFLRGFIRFVRHSETAFTVIAKPL